MFFLDIIMYVNFDYCFRICQPLLTVQCIIFNVLLLKLDTGKKSVPNKTLQ